MTKTARPSIPPVSFTASALQTLASLPEVRSTILRANRQPGAKAPRFRRLGRTWCMELASLTMAENKHVRILAPVLFQIRQYAFIGQVDSPGMLPVVARYLHKALQYAL